MRNFDIRWQNFRSFKDTKWLNLKPVTVLLGANGSGKTSVIAPILLLKQTHESRDTSLSLKTRGALFNAGSYEDVVYGHHLSREVALSIRFLERRTKSTETVRQVGREPPSILDLTFVPAENRDALRLKSFRIRDVVDRTMLHRVLDESGNYSLRNVDLTGAPDELLNAIQSSRPEGFLFTPDTVFSAYAKRVEDEVKSTKPSAPSLNVEISRPVQRYIQILAFTAELVRRLLANTAYIGPIRQRPKRIYELSGEVPFSVGPSGEYAPEIIYRAEDTSFLAAINEWVAKFQFGFNLQKDRLTDSVFSITLRRTSKSPKINLADTGFGLSQVLPLIVQGLSAQRGSVIIAEQPEIHLNPRLQAVLADLFCTIANRGVSVIVETHSEHLLLRLRRMVAEGKLKQTDVGLFFVERDRDTSSVREIPIDQLGHISGSDWPKGFFEDSLKESLALATAQQKAIKDVARSRD